VIVYAVIDESLSRTSIPWRGGRRLHPPRGRWAIHRGGARRRSEGRREAADRGARAQWRRRVEL